MPIIKDPDYVSKVNKTKIWVLCLLVAILCIILIFFLLPIGALPMVTPDCSESDFFTNSQLGYCADFDFGFEPIKGNYINSVAEVS